MEQNLKSLNEPNGNTPELSGGYAQQAATMPAEQVLPMIMTTVAVSLLKVAALAAVILVVKWFVGKINK